MGVDPLLRRPVTADHARRAQAQGQSDLFFLWLNNTLAIPVSSPSLDAHAEKKA